MSHIVRYAKSFGSSMILKRIIPAIEKNGLTLAVSFGCKEAEFVCVISEACVEEWGIGGASIRQHFDPYKSCHLKVSL